MGIIIIIKYNTYSYAPGVILAKAGRREADAHSIPSHSEPPLLRLWVTHGAPEPFLGRQE